MEVTFTKPFKKAYFKLSAKERLRVDKALVLFVEDRTNPTLRNHALKGNMDGRFSFSAAHDLRIVYREEDEFLYVFLIDVGSHNQVY